MKPKIFPHDWTFTKEGMFSEQDKPVSISIDKVNLEDRTPYRVFLEIEPPAVVDIVQTVIDNHKFYDLILAWHKKILSECPNAVKFVASCEPWKNPNDPVKSKTFSVSFLTSSKNTCPGQIFRQEIFERVPELVRSLPVTKRRSPPLHDRDILLDNFQFHIAVENSKWDNFFTEKIMDCFLSQTFPIYWGCPNLNEYFNMDGVLTFDTYDGLIEVLQRLTPEFHQKHIVAMEDNFQRTLAYTKCAPRVDSIIAQRLRERDQMR